MSQTPPKPTSQNQQGTTSQEPVRPANEMDDTPDFAEEFTTSGTEKNYWKNSNNKEDSKELLI